MANSRAAAWNCPSARCCNRRSSTGRTFGRNRRCGGLRSVCAGAARNALHVQRLGVTSTEQTARNVCRRRVRNLQRTAARLGNRRSWKLRWRMRSSVVRQRQHRASRANTNLPLSHHYSKLLAAAIWWSSVAPDCRPRQRLDSTARAIVLAFASPLCWLASAGWRATAGPVSPNWRRRRS